jgi:hypothetical protein
LDLEIKITVKKFMKDELTFGELLTQYMQRVKAGANDVAEAISTKDDKVTRQTIYNWQKNLTKPNLKNRPKIVALAKFLRLSKIETNSILQFTGFVEAYEEGNDFVGLMFTDYILALLKELSLLPYPVITLLNHANWDEPPIQKMLLFHAKRKYNTTFSIQPPYTGSERYFATLAQQCQFANVQNGAEFEWQLREQLSNRDEPLFLLVSRLEQGDPESRMKLIGILRSLSDEYENLLHVVLCGGEMLETICYQEGFSALNNGIVKHCPELGVNEVKIIAEYRFELELSDLEAKELLEISGGHPKLLKRCLDIKSSNLTLENYAEELKPEVWQFFMPFFKEKAKMGEHLQQECKAKMGEHLQQECVAKVQPFILDNLVRKLYWKNLLVERDGKLCWRCETLRMVGAEIFNLNES